MKATPGGAKPKFSDAELKAYLYTVIQTYPEELAADPKALMVAVKRDLKGPKGTGPEAEYIHVEAFSA